MALSTRQKWGVGLIVGGALSAAVGGLIVGGVGIPAWWGLITLAVTAVCEYFGITNVKKPESPPE